MNGLAIDCAVSRLAIAVKRDEKKVKLVYDIGIKQSEKLLPAIDFIMKEIGLQACDLDYTVLTSGPGTFTGLRLGLSTLKALTLAHGTPVYGVPSLESYAWPYKRAIESVLSVIEAKEDEYFYQFFVHGQKLSEPDDKPMDEIIKQMDPETSVLVCGPGARVFCERALEETPLYTIHCFSPEADAADNLFEIAEDMIRNKKEPLKDYDGPLYVRKSEAELVLEQKNKTAGN